MMRSYKYIAVSILVMIGNVIDLRAQEPGNKYLVEDRALAEQVRDAVVGEQSAGLDALKIGWAKSVIDEAFKRYFSSATFDIEGSETVVKLRDDLAKASDTIEALRSANRTLKTENEALKNKCDALSKSYKADIAAAKQEIIAGPLAEKNQECLMLNAQIESLNAQINSLNAQIESLNEEAEIARKVIAKHAEKKETVVSLYYSNANSKLEFVDAAAILSGVTDYEEYVALVELPIDPDLQKKIVFLKNLADAATFYKDAIAFMDSKFDHDRYNELFHEYSSLTIADLEIMQQTDLVQVGEAFMGLKESHEHFVINVLSYLNDQGLMPAQQIDYVRKEIDIMIGLFTGRKHQDADRYRYNPYYKNLNRVLDMAYNDLRKMNVAEYEAYIKKLKENL